MPDEVTLDIRGLERIKKEVLKNYVVKVGILGSNDNRDGENSNATIGLKHEFGSASDNVPERSFLRAPLREKMPEELKGIGQDYFDSLTEDNIENFFEKLGIKAEEIIQNAFDTRGFGKWAALSNKTVKKKGFDTVLVETTQLRNSIMSEVIKGNTL